MLFHFDIENAITDDHSFHIEAQDLMEAHVKALEFVRELDAEIKKRTDGAIDADLKLTGVSIARLEMADKEAVDNYSSWLLDALVDEVAEEDE